MREKTLSIYILLILRAITVGTGPGPRILPLTPGTPTTPYLVGLPWISPKVATASGSKSSTSCLQPSAAHGPIWLPFRVNGFRDGYPGKPLNSLWDSETGKEGDGPVVMSGVHPSSHVPLRHCSPMSVQNSIASCPISKILTCDAILMG